MFTYILASLKTIPCSLETTPFSFSAKYSKGPESQYVPKLFKGLKYSVLTKLMKKEQSWKVLNSKE